MKIENLSAIEKV